jgi:hypothetical protein
MSIGIQTFSPSTVPFMKKADSWGRGRGRGEKDKGEEKGSGTCDGWRPCDTIAQLDLVRAKHTKHIWNIYL